MKILIFLLLAQLPLFSDSPFRSEIVTSSPFLSTIGKGGERRNNLHKGWDGYPVDFDWIVFPIMDGTVIKVDQNRIDGKYIVMHTKGGLYHKYCHAETIYNYYNVGDYLTTKNYIMKMGETGYTDGPHIHIETYRVSLGKKIYYNPENYFRKKDRGIK